MSDNFETQYDTTARDFNEFYLNQEVHQSTDIFFKAINELSDVKTTKVLDLGCGAGADATFYTQKGFSYYGLDASKEMCALAEQNEKVTEIKNESFSNTISYNDGQFDLVVSKYAIQTSQNIKPIYDQVERVLAKDGYFVFLVVHPMRQFLEKKKDGKNYFEKEIVKSVIFEGKIIVSEPSHTLSEYINKDFLSKFVLLDIVEGSDFPNSEQINGDIYPTFLIITAQKK